MFRSPIKNFSSQEIERIFIAQNTIEAEQVEQLLTENRVDYAISLERFWPFSIIRTDRIGAVFYVVSTQADFCRQIIKKKGLGVGIVYD